MNSSFNRRKFLQAGTAGVLSAAAFRPAFALERKNAVKRKIVVKTYTYKKVNGLEIKADVHRADDRVAPGFTRQPSQEPAEAGHHRGVGLPVDDRPRSEVADAASDAPATSTNAVAHVGTRIMTSPPARNLRGSPARSSAAPGSRASPWAEPSRCRSRACFCPSNSG